FFPADVGIAVAVDAGLLNGRFERHAVLQLVENHLEDGGDNGRAAGGADGQDRFSVPEHDGGGHGAHRPLEGPDFVGTAGNGVEIGQLVVQQDAVFRHHDPASEELLDRGGVGNQVAPPVGHGEV